MPADTDTPTGQRAALIRLPVRGSIRRVASQHRTSCALYKVSREDRPETEDASRGALTTRDRDTRTC